MWMEQRTRRWIRVEAVVWILATVLCVAASSGSRRARSSSAQCPIGFSLTRVDGDAVCYKLKGPEKFDEKFVGCAGNGYASQLLRRAEFSPKEDRLWADYVNLYSGGPFVDWSYRDSTGKLLESTYDVAYAPQDVGEDLCTVLDTATGNLTAVGCMEKQYRYCFVRPYGDVEQDGCGEGYVRLRSPLASCVQRVTGVGGAVVRATWRQAQGICRRREGRLLQRSWRYSNHPALHAAPATGADWVAPLGIVMARGGKGLNWANPSEGEGDEVPDSELGFPPSEKFENDTELVALKGDSWMLVNETYTFYDVICEQSVALTAVRMKLTYTTDGRLQLDVSETGVKEDDIDCFTDSKSFPTIEHVDVSRIQHTSSFNVKPESDGYYWCLIARNSEFLFSQSNKELFMKDKNIAKLFAIKIEVKRDYNLKEVKKMEEEIWKKLNEFTYKWNKYVMVNGENVSKVNIIERVLAAYEGKMDISKDEVIFDFKLKRAYLDRRTLLYHAHTAVTIPLVAGSWRDIEVAFMKPVYFCPAFDKVPMKALEEEVTISCTTYRCVGDYNEGVQWVETQSSHCQQQRHSTHPVDLSSSITVGAQARTEAVTEAELVTERTTTESSSEEVQPSTQTTALLVTPERPTTVSLPTEVVSTAHLPSPPTSPPPPPPTVPPTATSPPPPPTQIIDNVMDNLEGMIQDENAPITIEHMMETANQVNTLLDLSPEAEIPGRLLHIIDEVGARIDLNGSQSAAEVRDNIGLVVANSAPGTPIRGLRLAHSDDGTNGALTKDAFHIITGDMNDTYMNWNTSEVVVNLPESLVDADRRVTFVVFRNNRAFHSASDPDNQRVNSRVLSVTVSNFKFTDRDFVDIHLRPIESDVPRDRRRVCAYWHFDDNETGYWSQEGCTLIPSGGADRLDVCRCTHLTHFAEILAPRTVFPERDESALEVISVVGCFLSIIGLLLIGLTAAMFSAWRRDFNNKVWLQLSAAILLLAIAFLIVAFSKFDGFSALCMLSGVALHYATLASFCWMLVAAVLSYRRLVLVFTRDASHKLLRACAFAWGAPFVIIGILLAADPRAYSGRFGEVDHTTGSFCYPTGVALWLTVYSPIAVALLANWTLFALIVRSVFVLKRIRRHGDTGEALRCATVSFLLVFLFGLPWIFGLFSTVLAFAYMFALTATYQGFVLFLFFVVGNKKTRDMWFNQLKITQKQRLPVTSSTYKSNGWRGGGAGGGGGGGAVSSSSGLATLEEANGKPRSLSGRDDMARFS